MGWRAHSRSCCQDSLPPPAPPPKLTGPPVVRSITGRAWWAEALALSGPPNPLNAFAHMPTMTATRTARAVAFLGSALMARTTFFCQSVQVLVAMVFGDAPGEPGA